MHRIKLSRTKLKRIAVAVLLLVIVFYIFCLIFCTVSVFHMRTLNYNSSGWGVVLTEYKFDFVNDLVEVNNYDFDGTLRNHGEDHFSKEQQRKVRLACAISLMPVWKKEYYNPAIQDGEQWHLSITYDEKEKYIYGSNAHPLLYHVAYDAIKSVVDSIK